MRSAFWGEYGNGRRFRKTARHQAEQKAREARSVARRTRATVPAQVGRRPHGRTVRARRDMPAIERYRAEYRTVSRKLLEEAMWPGITETAYVALRRATDARGGGDPGNVG